ncbi:hypothetical protein PSTT_13142 [Puccinia striiformis]|uniref:Uncharacterized protein n=1 Tax=Puccinia striiformis TaxID=27350 RepID=A0A2S4UTH7_9BASI|nr:hypothetical protein PSTT_13142 [Puccinia striiformis]
MARERIITLRHLSQDIHGLSAQASVLRETGDDKYEDQESLISPSKPRRESRTPVLVVEDCSSVPDRLTKDGRKRTTYCQSNLSKSPPITPTHGAQYFNLNPQDDDEEDRRTAISAEGEYNHPLLQSNLMKHSFSDDPIVRSSAGFDSQPEKSYLPQSVEALDMGQFMNQVSKLSTRIDGFESELSENSSSFSNDPEFRSDLYDRIDKQVIQDLVVLQTTSRQIKSSQTDHLRSHRDKDDDHGNAEKGKLLIALKKSKTISNLITRLTNEKQIITNQMEYEWTKELNQGSIHSKASLSITTLDCFPGDDNNGSQDSHLFSMLGLDQINDDPRASKVHSEEVQKILNSAVRSSTCYPEARKSSLFIKSKYDLVLRIQGELRELNQFLELLSSPRSRNSPDDEGDVDDSSSASFSLDGLENDDKHPDKDDASYRKTKKLRFKIGGQTKGHKSDKMEDLEHNSPKCHRLSYGSNLSGDKSFHDTRSCLSRYRLAILCKSLSSVKIILTTTTLQSY